MKLQEKTEKKQHMYYGKLEDHFDEICNAKSLDKNELKNRWIKDFVEKHKKHCTKKYYLKYEGDKEEILVYGDSGKYFELSDGSLMEKRTFEKMFKSEKTGDIEINPYDFFNNNAINVKEVEKPINIDNYNKNRLELAQSLKDFFENIDTKNMKEPKKNVNIDMKKPVWNNIPPKHNQNEEWIKREKKKN